MSELASEPFVLYTIKYVQIIECIPQKQLESDEESAPSLVVFCNEEEDFMLIHLVRDGCKVSQSACHVPAAAPLLLGAYDTFYLDYPVIFAQFFGILHFSEQFRLAYVRK